MSNLSNFFNPKSIAVIGASDEEGTVGWRLFKNLVENGYNGRVYPINIRKQKILGFRAYQSVEQLPERVDLAVIAVPAKVVPSIVEQCGKVGIDSIIIISAGFKEIGQEGKALEDRIAEIRLRYGMRIIGPNCLGLVRPSINLNATFLRKMPKAGNIALISQSGALGAAMVDWTIKENIGLSIFISVGSMLDVDFGDLVDYIGNDPETKSILLYMEGVTDAKKFVKNARKVAKIKPIITIKSGRFSESAKAVASHTGSLAGEDNVYDAVFKRIGIVRVEEIQELFNCAEALAKQPLPNGPRLAIITNAGGPGIMAADALLARNGRLAVLSSKTMDTLNKALPSHWSKGNPIDLIGDADTERYRIALEACLEDDGIDGILVIYTQSFLDSVDLAHTIIDVYSKSKRNKPVLTSLMGQWEAHEILNKYGIPTYDTPEQAVKTFMYMYQYKNRLELLDDSPEPYTSIATSTIITSDKKARLLSIINNALNEGRVILNEVEAKEFISCYNIPTVKTLVAKDEDSAVDIANMLGYPVVLKILSPDIVHKTDVGGVILDLKNEQEVRYAYREIMSNVKMKKPDARILGVTVQPMVSKRGIEVILGSKHDPIFGPVILFGMGGVGVEIFKDFTLELPPLNSKLARSMIEGTKVYNLLKGYRGMPAADVSKLEEVMLSFSNMLIDFPQIREVDMNPIIVYMDNITVLDARIVI
jgi:acetyltransferase